MKKLFAMMLVIMMACCALFTAGAEGFMPGSDDALTISVAAEISPDGLDKVLQMSGGNTANVPPEAIQTVLAIINNMKFKGTIQGKEAQLDILLKDTPIVNLAGQAGDDGITVVTNLLPNYVAFVTNQELEQLMEQMKANAASGFDMNFTEEEVQKVINVAMEKLSPAVMKIMSSFGPEEAGSWMFEGKEFTTRKPLNMTTKEVVVTVLEGAESFVSDADVQSFMGHFGVKPEQMDLSSALQNVKDADESTMPALTFFLYGNADGETYFTLELVKDNQGIKAEGGMVNGEVICHINSNPDMFEVDINIKQTGEFYIYTGMNGQAMSNGGSSAPFNMLEIIVEGKPEGEGYYVNVRYLIDQADFATLKMAFEKGGEITASFDKTGKKILSMQDIMTLVQGGNNELLAALQGELTTSGMAILGQLASIMPNEMTQLMTLVNSMNMR